MIPNDSGRPGTAAHFSFIKLVVGREDAGLHLQWCPHVCVIDVRAYQIHFFNEIRLSLDVGPWINSKVEPRGSIVPFSALYGSSFLLPHGSLF